MITHILFDADGVLLHREMYFSARLARDYNIDPELINEFFKHDFHKCVVGHADIRDLLPPYLERWGWTEGLDALLDFWFSTDGILQDDLLLEIDALRAQGIRCYLATDNEKRRLAYILDTVGLRSHFDGVFASSELGAAKLEPAFWHSVIAELQTPPEQILFVDDDPKNVALAREMGFAAEVYTDLPHFLAIWEALQ